MYCQTYLIFDQKIYKRKLSLFSVPNCLIVLQLSAINLVSLAITQ